MAVISKYENIVDSIRNSSGMHNFWKRYQKEFDYAKDITFEDACEAILKLMDSLNSK